MSKEIKEDSKKIDKKTNEKEEKKETPISGLSE
jgi:hypothetical protein